MKLAIALLFLLFSAAFPQAPVYTTNFPNTENPISENGQWINGKDFGVDWANVQTTPDLAFGTPLPSQYGDSTAILTGSWSPDQSAQATIKVVSGSAQCCHEVELRLRTVISAHSITGYEINCSVDGSKYLQIVRWNGPLGNFDYVTALSTGCKNGDVLRAKIVGDVISVYKNDVLILQGTDSTFKQGAPGIGFYDDQDDNWNHFGFFNFTAQNEGSASIPPPSPGKKNGHPNGKP